MQKFIFVDGPLKRPFAKMIIFSHVDLLNAPHEKKAADLVALSSRAQEPPHSGAAAGAATVGGGSDGATLGND